jgi:uncharacterized protein YyaL (SSP411 family)
MSNRLADESSPYLLQHRDNPVDWYPWGEEALYRSREEDRPIFLSIGYSACHWCHVMEYESFENDAIAAALNERFVCIKVDREERPDLDQIYMNAVQAMTDRGGWPMSVFLTPDLKPFFGGTYWPPTASRGMPGFDQVIAGVSDAWNNRREQALQQADELTGHLQQLAQLSAPAAVLADDVLHHAAAQLERVFDFSQGGFGGAPKFPHPLDLKVLLRFWRRDARVGVMQMVRLTLDKMAGGGIYDHLGGGFARYSVDAQWLVPHFEKMLYDNALLADAYLEGFLATGEEHYAGVVRETLDYVLRDMTDTAGGFYSTEDADSEGVEGKFYVWTPTEIADVLGEKAAEMFCYVYDVSESGNFEGKNILNLPKTIEQCAQVRGVEVRLLANELTEGREKLFAERKKRIHPGLDDKVLTSWNGLIIHALARAGAVLGEPRYGEAATQGADFVLAQLRRDDGRLLHTWRHGVAKLDAYLDDYAAMINALVSVYEATFDEQWIDKAIGLADVTLAHFADPDGDGFFYTADDHEQLIARVKDVQDSSVPSGNGLVATALARLGVLTGRNDYVAAAESAVRACAAMLKEHPTAAGQALVAHDFLSGSVDQVVILADKNSPDAAAALNSLRGKFLPNMIVACRDEESGSGALDKLFAGKPPVAGGLTVYVCRDFVCEAPVSGREGVVEALGRLE